MSEQTVIERTAELVTRERESRTLTESSSGTIARYDRESRHIYADPAFCALAGCNLTEALGKQPSELPDGDNARIYEKIISDVTLNGTSAQFELRWADKDGQEQCSHARLAPETDQAGNVRSVLAVGRDLPDRMASGATVWKQANPDVLTGLPDRRVFHERLAQEANEPGCIGRRMALMLINLDRSKEANDPLGHDRGDTLLTETGKRIGSCVRQSDTVAHLSDDEFTVILPNVDDAESVERIAWTIIGKLVGPFKLGADEAFVSASTSVTFYPDGAHDLDVLFKNADQAMYAAKNAGRNRFSYFKLDMQVGAEQRLRLTSDLRTALPDGQFQIYYQPIVELATGEVCKAEALIRWLHPERGTISPHDLISVAEGTGLIIPIGDWILKQAVRQARRWRNRFHPSFQTSVNMSPVRMRQDGQLCARWPDFLARRELPAQSVMVEITEELLLQAESRTDETLLTLHSAGTGISIDNFETGYSSLAYLRRFDINYLKIDRSFVHNLSFNEDNQALYEVMVVLAHKLGLKVITESVETAEQRDSLKTVDCDFA